MKNFKKIRFAFFVLLLSCLLLPSCARKDDSRPLWVLVWGGLSDLAQALHDAPDIAERIRVYFIGGPNKGGVNSYHYIAENFPELWMIEDNASYRGFIWDAEIDDEYNNPAVPPWAIKLVLQRDEI